MSLSDIPFELGKLVFQDGSFLVSDLLSQRLPSFGLDVEDPFSRQPRKRLLAVALQDVKLGIDSHVVLTAKASGIFNHLFHINLKPFDQTSNSMELNTNIHHPLILQASGQVLLRGLLPSSNEFFISIGEKPILRSIVPAMVHVGRFLLDQNYHFATVGEILKRDEITGYYQLNEP